MSLFYFILFVISFLYLALLLWQFKNHVSVFYMLLSVCIMLINYGFWQVSIATTLDAALSATKISYLGSGFVAFFMVCSISKLCKFRLHPAILIVWFVICTFITFAAQTVGHSDIYYRSVELIHENGFTYLKKEYGPAHKLFTMNIMLCFVCSLLILVQAFIRRKKVSHISGICSLLVMGCVSAVYFVQGKYPLLPLAYDVGFAIILLLLLRIRLYDTKEISKEALQNNRRHGFVTIDSRARFLDGDEMARIWFPELNELKIDAPIPGNSTEFLQQIRQWVINEDTSSGRLFQCGEQVIEARPTVVHAWGRRKIYCIHLHDDTRQQKYTQLIENYNQNLQHDVAQKTQKLEQIQDDIIISMVSIVENRDSSTGGHVRRTSDVVRVFVGYLIETGCCPELDEHMADCIVRAAPLHDFGKIGIPDEILNKPGRYTPEEYAVMKKHPVLGTAIVERILKSSEDVLLRNTAVNVAHYHHEKWDGSGYPEGLRGNEIPFEARVMALADVFDALVSKRTYKEAYSFEKAYDIIQSSGGSHFDPTLCSHFLNCRDRLTEVYLSESAEA